MEISLTPLRLDPNLRTFRTASDAGLQDQAVPFTIRYPALLAPAGMVGRKHHERGRAELPFQLRVPLMARRTVALAAERLQRASLAAQTPGNHVLPASRLTDEGRLAKDAFAHSSVSRQSNRFHPRANDPGRHRAVPITGHAVYEHVGARMSMMTASRFRTHCNVEHREVPARLLVGARTEDEVRALAWRRWYGREPTAELKGPMRAAAAA